MWIVAGVVAISLVRTSTSFQNCIQERKENSAYQSLREGVSVIRGTIIRERLTQACIGHFVDKNEGSITAIATLLIGVFTIVLAGATRSLWESAESQLDAFRKAQRESQRNATQQDAAMQRSVMAAEESAKAAVLSADAAKLSVDITQQIAERQLRAYVHVSNAGIISKENEFVVAIRFRNSGQTPAYKYTIRMGIGLDVYPFSKTRIGEALDNGPIVPNQQTLPPTGSTDMREGLPLMPQHVNDIAIGKAAIWFYGRITYLDAFEKSRFTEFRQYCTGPQWQLGVFVVDDEGNESS